MKSYSMTGGILSIVCGGFGLCGLLFWIFMVLITRYSYMDMSGDMETSIQDLNVAIIVYLVIGMICALIGTLAIVGGAFALKRNLWGLALAGAIAGTFTFFPLGIMAIVFTSLGKSEFDKPKVETASVEAIRGAGI